jgi:hypothetical protein
LGIFRVAGRNPLVKNKAGDLHGHQVHSTVMALRTPVYSSAPRGVLYIWIIQSREGSVSTTSHLQLSLIVLKIHIIWNPRD